MAGYRIIDCDIHNTVSAQDVRERLPEPHRTRHAAGSGPGHLGYWNPNGVMRSDTRLDDGRKIENDPHLLAAHFFDVYGLDYGIFNTSNLQFGLCPDPDYAAAIMRATNDTIAEVWLPVDDRFRSSLQVAPNDPKQAAAEIRRLGGHPGFVQVLMCSGASVAYGNRCYDPIYEAACEMDLPVAIHPGSEGVGTSGAPTAAGYPSSYFEWHTGLVGSYLAHLLSLVCEGTFVKFPGLKFVLIEGGVSWLPPILWRLDKNWKALRMSTPWLERPPSELVCEHIRLTTQPIEEPPDPAQLHQLLAMLPAEQMLMFSTDYPHWDGDTPDFAARWLPDHLKPAVMDSTARSLYRLPERVHA